MDSKTLNGKIEVIDSYRNGEQIQMFDTSSNKWIDLEMEPEFNFGTTLYRVKPKLEYRPYRSSKEFMDASKEHGPWLIWAKENGIIENVIPSYCTDDGSDVLVRRIGADNTSSLLSLYNFSYDEMLKANSFVWQDGTQCGIKNDD